MNQFNQEKNIIELWISGFLSKQIPYSIVSNNFKFENGLSLSELIEYEQNQFNSLSSLYDLDKNFFIQIYYINKISETKNQIFYKVLNSKNLTVFKWYITLEYINNEIYVSSNDFISQIIHKFKILWNKNNNHFIIQGINFAIKTEKGFLLNKIINPYYELNKLSEDEDNDGFVFAEFNNDNNLHKDINLKIIYSKNNEKIIENRHFPLFTHYELDPPFIINENNLIILNEKYPYNLFYSDKTGKKHINNPRNITLDIKNVSHLIITDCLDNDWYIV